MTDPIGLVGRREELALAASWIQSPSGPLLVLGQPGIGKSALLARIVEIAPRRIVTLRCSTSETVAPWSALGPLVRRLAPEAEGAAAWLARAWNTIAPGAIDGYEPSRMSDQTLRSSVVELIRNVAVSTPLLFIVDDAHLAGPFSSSIVAEVASWNDPRVEVLVASRPLRDGDESPSWLVGLASGATVITLKELSEADAALLVARIRRRSVRSRGDTLPTEEALFSICRGHPLFTIMVAGQTPITGRTPSPSSARCTDGLTSAVAEFVAYATATLEPASRAVLDVIALSPRALDVEIASLAASRALITEGQRSQVGAAQVRLLIEHGLVVDSDVGCNIAHELIAEDLRARMGPWRRRAMSAALAEVLIDRPEADPAEVLSLARPTQRPELIATAVAQFLARRIWSAPVAVLDDAVATGRAAVDTAPVTADTEAVRLHVELGALRVAWRTLRLDDVMTLSRAVEGLARECGLEAAELEAKHRRTQAAAERGAYTSAVSEFRRIEERARSSGSPVIHEIVAAKLRYERLIAQRPFTSMLSELETHLEGRDDIEIALRDGLRGHLLQDLGRLGEAIEAFRSSAAMHALHRERRGEALGWINIARTHLCIRDIEAARVSLIHARALLEEIGQPSLIEDEEATLLTYSDPVSASRELHRCYHEARNAGHGDWASELVVPLAAALSEAADHDRLLDLVRIRRLEKSDHPKRTTAWTREAILEAHAALIEERHDTVLELANDVWDGRQTTAMVAVEQLCRVAADAGSRLGTGRGSIWQSRSEKLITAMRASLNNTAHQGVDRTDVAAVAGAVGGFEGGFVMLSPAQRRVAEVLAEGLTVRQAADRLLLATKTVDAHLQHIYRKLGIHSRAELARIYERSRQHR